MIIELLQLLSFLLTGTVRGLFIFFLTHLGFLMVARHYSNKYRTYSGDLPMNATIIIATWNEEPEYLERAILSALNSGASEVMVVYSINDEKAVKVVEKYANRIRRLAFKTRVPKKRAVYEAIRRAQSDFIVILDSDTFLEPYSLREILKPFRDEKVGAVTAHYAVFNTHHFAGRLSGLIEASRNFINRALSYFGQVHVVDSKFCAYRRQAILPLMEEYLHNTWLGRDVVIGEDKQLTGLLQRSGYKCVMQDSAVCYTAAPPNIIKFLKQQLRWARSGYMYLFRHWWCLKLNPLLTAHMLLYFLSPIIFPIIVIYDLLFTPPLIDLMPGMELTVMVAGVSSITWFRSKLANLGIRPKDLPIIGLFGLVVMMPLMIYALLTVWKQGNWLSR